MDVPKGMKAGQTFVLDLEKKPAGARQQTLAQKLPTAAARKVCASCLLLCGSGGVCAPAFWPPGQLGAAGCTLVGPSW